MALKLGGAADDKGNKIVPEKTDEDESNVIRWGVSDSPPVQVTLVAAVQVILTSVTGIIANSVLVSSAVCGPSWLTARLTNTCLFLCGLTTLLQNLVGVRLPVFQGTTIHYVAPILSRSELPDWRCDPLDGGNSSGQGFDRGLNSTQPHLDWEYKMSEISGVMIAVSVVHALTGLTGVAGLITRVAGPLTLTPAILVILLNLSRTLFKFTAAHFGISGLSMGLTLVLSSYMARVAVPLPTWSRKEGWYVKKSKFLRIYAVIISIGAGWLLAFVLTITGRLTSDPDSPEYQARTDKNTDLVGLSDWLYLPYPGQFGPPRFSVTILFGLAFGMLGSVLDSVADYDVVSRVCGVPRPPRESVNRGLLVEGICNTLFGAFGVGFGTSVYSGITATIAVTGVTSRRVLQVAGLLMMALGVLGKVGAILVLIPTCVVSAVTLAAIALVIGRLLGGLGDVDMTRSRNCLTVGLALSLGTALPEYIKGNRNIIDTGLADLDVAIRSMLGSPLFVTGILACFLDNTLPGDRGEKTGEDGCATTSGLHPAHRLPYIQDYLLRCRWTKFCPFLPRYQTRVSEHKTSLKNKV